MRFQKIKRILVIEPCYQNFGGYFRAINLCQSLSSHNIHVDLISPSPKKFSLSISRKFVNSNLQLIELPRFNLSFYFNLRLLRALISTFIALFGNYDLIQASVPSQPETNIPALFCKLFHRRVVIDWDDIISDGEIKNKFINYYLRFCEKYFPKLFSNYIVVTDYLKKIAIKRGAKKVLILINGINTSQFNLIDQEIARKKIGLDLNQKYLLSFGNTFSQSRIFNLLKCFEYIYHQNSNIKLILNFDPRNNSDFFKYSSKLDQRIFKNIIFTGYIQPETVPYYLSASNALLFLFGTDLNEKACFPIRIGTFLNGEKPLFINNNHSYVCKILKNYHASIIENDLQSLANQVIHYLSHPSAYKKQIHQVRQAKKKLSWTSITIPLIKYYQNL